MSSLSAVVQEMQRQMMQVVKQGYETVKKYPGITTATLVSGAILASLYVGSSYENLPLSENGYCPMRNSSGPVDENLPTCLLSPRQELPVPVSTQKLYTDTATLFAQSPLVEGNVTAPIFRAGTPKEEEPKEEERTSTPSENLPRDESSLRDRNISLYETGMEIINFVQGIDCERGIASLRSIVRRLSGYLPFAAVSIIGDAAEAIHTSGESLNGNLIPDYAYAVLALGLRSGGKQEPVVDSSVAMQIKGESPGTNLSPAVGCISPESVRTDNHYDAEIKRLKSLLQKAQDRSHTEEMKDLLVKTDAYLERLSADLYYGVEQLQNTKDSRLGKTYTPLLYSKEAREEIQALRRRIAFITESNKSNPKDKKGATLLWELFNPKGLLRLENYRFYTELRVLEAKDPDDSAVQKARGNWNVLTESLTKLTQSYEENNDHWQRFMDQKMIVWKEKQSMIDRLQSKIEVTQPTPPATTQKDETVTKKGSPIGDLAVFAGAVAMEALPEGIVSGFNDTVSDLGKRIWEQVELAL